MRDGIHSLEPEKAVLDGVAALTSADNQPHDQKDKTQFICMCVKYRASVWKFSLFVVHIHARTAS